MTKVDIKNDLVGLGIAEGDIVFFHSSLKSIGHVEGGAGTVIDGFLETIGKRGTLVLPALCRYDWESMSRQDIEQAWDIHTTPTFTGLIPETLRKRPESLRSDNATHSVTAVGHHAREITRYHQRARGGEGAPGRPKWASPGAFGFNSPWDKLYELDAKYLMIGVDFSCCTMLHHVQAVFWERYLRKIDRDAAWPVFSFPQMGKDIEDRELVRFGHIGNAAVRLIGSRLLVDSAIERLIEEKGPYDLRKCRITQRRRNPVDPRRRPHAAGS